MAFNRRARALWTGSLQDGGGNISFTSGALPDAKYDVQTRFGEKPGTNPEELLAASHAACYSMALTAFLNRQNLEPKSIDTQAVCTVDQVDGGFKITRVRLRVAGDVPGITKEQFVDFANQAEKQCPVSNALRNNVEVVVEPELT
ncbi:MAG: OsmC family protein [Candidatus Baltobacteraceae bacterium]